ncbi:Trm112 family protein [uncultured Rhodoblastus sp.]|uniref:Trm112 family protein n=1 Tax=uncultured Rhodoblastus sp. TaxID=543037 RepID=UPI0025F5FD6F|nr:Trm112 family protein [uncultured Rhodoblastus sp.]
MNDSASPGSAAPAVLKNSAGTAGVDPRLLEILVCPVTKTTLRYDRERNELVSLAAHLAYPIRDGIPIMLPEEARRIEE